MRRPLIFLGAATLIFLAVSCSSSSNSSSSSGSTTTPPPTGVTISPQTVTLSRGATRQFTAAVLGSSDQSVVWEVNGVRGGSSAFGLISTDGVYIAPTTVPSSPTVTVTAASFADPTVSASASVTIQTGSNIGVVIIGGNTRITIPTFGSRVFSAAVSGTENAAVTWQVNGVDGGSAVTGTISSSGIYSAPRSVPVSTLPNNAGQATEVIVIAVSQADSTASDSAIVVPVPAQQGRFSQPIPLGTSGGNGRDTSVSGSLTFCCGGTLGSLVSRGGRLYILSNTHVLARSDLAAAGEPIVQPALVDNRCSTAGLNTVGSLSQYFNLESGPAPHVDAAIAEILANAVDSLGTIVQLGGATNGGQPTDGTPNPGPGVAPAVGQPVAKSGSATGLTCSSVLAIGVTVSVQYQKGCSTGKLFTVNYTNQVDVSGVGFSAEGDSGSLIVTQDTADPVGLLYGGSDTDTLANPVANVLAQLADPVSSELPLFVGDATVGPHPVEACNLTLPQSETAKGLRTEAASVSTLALQAAIAVRDARAPELMAYPGVQALGVGASLDAPGAPAIVFFVRRGQAPAALPAEVDGVRTLIVEGDDFGKSGLLTEAETQALERQAAPPKLVYPISEAEVARGEAAVIARAAGLMEHRGIQGVGVSSSLDAPGEAALMIFAVRGVPRDPIPAVIDGLRTRIRETSRFRAR
jgi:hypothetical protein